MTSHRKFSFDLVRNSLSEWLNNRLYLDYVREFFSRKFVPRHKYSFFYLFGGLTLFFFLIQFSTGILLLFYYSPTPDTAFESVQFIVERVPHGWLIRSIHSWSSNLMVASILIHFFSTYFMKAYRKPRELMWISGSLLLFITLGFGFTGYLLPWDTTSYFATQIGTEIPRSIPIVGELIVMLLRGGEYIASESLKRLFALHVIILPILSFILILFHLILNQVYGTSVPIGIQSSNPSIPFYPNYIYRDLLVWLGGLVMLLTLSILFPIQIGSKADYLASAPIGIRPEWYFIPLYQTLRMFPSQVFGIQGEVIINILVMLISFLIFLLPFIDKKANQDKVNPLYTHIGLVVFIYLIITICLGYLI